MKIVVTGMAYAKDGRMAIKTKATDALVEQLTASSGIEITESDIKSGAEISFGGVSYRTKEATIAFWSRKVYLDKLNIAVGDELELSDFGFHAKDEAYTGHDGSAQKARKDGFHWNKISNPLGELRDSNADQVAKAEAKKTLALASELGISKSELAERLFGKLSSAPAPAIKEPELSVE